MAMKAALILGVFAYAGATAKSDDPCECTGVFQARMLCCAFKPVDQHCYYNNIDGRCEKNSSSLVLKNTQVLDSSGSAIEDDSCKCTGVLSAMMLCCAFKPADERCYWNNIDSRCEKNSSLMAPPVVESPCGCFGHDGTGDAVCAPHLNSTVCLKAKDAYEKVCTWKEACPLAKEGQECCPTSECQKKMRSPACNSGLKCYAPSLQDSGTCMKASSLAEKGERCCIFCKTAPPCDTGLKCHTADPYSEGVCTDPWFQIPSLVV